jgi:HK97 family phage prohead protease
MSTPFLIRTNPVDLEVTSAGDGRTICGLAVPFGVKATVSDDGGRTSYVEQFRNGAFARTIRERGAQSVKSLAMHAKDRLPIGRASLLREDHAGLYAEIRVSKTTLGDEVLELVRDGSLDSLSIGFRGVHHVPLGRDHIERTEVALREISPVWAPAYEGAAIAGVRTSILTNEQARDRDRFRLNRLLE